MPGHGLERDFARHLVRNAPNGDVGERLDGVLAHQVRRVCRKWDSLQSAQCRTGHCWDIEHFCKAKKHRNRLQNPSKHTSRSDHGLRKSDLSLINHNAQSYINGTQGQQSRARFLDCNAGEFCDRLDFFLCPVHLGLTHFRTTSSDVWIAKDRCRSEGILYEPWPAHQQTNVH